MKVIGKHGIVFLLLLAIIHFSLKEAFIVSYYQINRTSITELLCINKKNVELTCNGKCHLKTLLEASKQPKNYPVPIPSIEDKIPYTFNLGKAEKTKFSNIENRLNQWYNYNFSYSYTPLFKIFHPPRRHMII